ncbi:hypothetical protein F442_22597 [Phytophthora nicotianae P10297]|uniref:Uncharacterized protein n=1 Tax=Phytophthora nicotianae P10297 TaxID=1317064 RepID=W2Y060_PHYNI|nr:hypothetical protein F442_22597 [Phytophthora nicotianae P10297]
MGQSLGRLKDRYIHFGEGVDQLCGRMTAGLPFDSDRFGVLPPHFPSLITSQMTVQYWDEVVSGFSNYPRGIQSAFPFLLASIIFHEDYLRKNLCENHPIFKSRAFSSNLLLHLQRDAPILSIGTSPVCSLKATGIPLHLAVAQQVRHLKEEVANLRTSMETTLPSTIVREMRQHFVVNGVAPISLHDLDSRISELETRMTARFSSALLDIQIPRTTTEPTTTNGQHNWQTWSWNDGQICHNVLKDWEFPARANAKLLWNLWFFGDKDVGIRPYRLLNKQYDILPQHQMRYTRVRIVMEHLEQLAKEAQLFPSGLTSVSMLEIPAADEVFDTSFAMMLSKLYTRAPKRAEDLSCGTLYNRLCQYRKKNTI